MIPLSTRSKESIKIALAMAIAYAIALGWEKPFWAGFAVAIEWIRLAQRVPVRIHLTEVPEGVDLRVGTSASVLVMTGTAGEQGGEPVAAAPKALQ